MCASIADGVMKGTVVAGRGARCRGELQPHRRLENVPPYRCSTRGILSLVLHSITAPPCAPALPALAHRASPAAAVISLALPAVSGDHHPHCTATQQAGCGRHALSHPLCLTPLSRARPPPLPPPPGLTTHAWPACSRPGGRWTGRRRCRLVQRDGRDPQGRMVARRMVRRGAAHED